MLKRTITGACLIAVAIPIIFFSDTWILPVVAAFLSITAAFEVVRCIGVVGKYRMTIPIYVYAVTLPSAARIFLIFGQQDRVFEIFTIMTVGLAIYLFAIMMFSHGKIVYREIAEAFMTVLYTTCGFTSMVFLNDHHNGVFTLILIFLAAITTDIFAYLCGKLFGKHKLIPDVSPNKTVEGSVGGMIFCELFLFGYGCLLQYGLEIPIKFSVLLIGGIFISIVSQIGDLIMSSIKRAYGIKDFGKIFPGHGGVLDRFDSSIAVAIILLPIVTFFGIFPVI